MRVLLGIGALVAAFSGTSVAATDRPNIILIVADDLGYSDLGCQGAKDIRTPNIDRLAQEGTRFTSFCVAQPVCTASRASLMSGCYANRIGMSGALNHTSTIGINPNEELLPELLKANGYATAHYGKWHLGTHPRFFPTRNGFDEWVGLPYSNDNGPLHPTVRGIPSLPLYSNDEVIEKDPDQSKFTRLFTEKAVGFIRSNRARPFFLYLPHVMPHVPIFASEQFKGKSGRGLYGDTVEELDWGVGEILNAVKESGIEQNTLILFMSDNGPFLSYGSHAGSAGPFREGKLTTFEGGVRVPFIARMPGTVPAGRVCDELITGLDLLPTLASLTGSALPRAKIDGLNLAPLLKGEKDAKGRESFAYFSGAELHAVRSGKWKLHVPHPYLVVNGAPGKNGKPANYENMKPEAIEESGIRGIASRHGYQVRQLEPSLFDLSADPGETRNLAAENPEVVKRLNALADSFRAELGDSLTNVKGGGSRPAGRDEITSTPNVLFILADDLRVELGCYGSIAKTPNLDKLAKRGLRFDRAYCQQAVCNPSRSSFLTGKRPDTLHLWVNGTHFREKNPDVKTIPLWFKENGRETRGIGKIFHNWHTKEKGDRRSWSADEFLHYANHGDDKPEVKGELPPNLALDIGRAYGAVPLCERRDVPDEAYYDGRVASEAVKTLEAIKDRPFFLAVGFWKPHAPFNAPKKYWDLYDPRDIPRLNPDRPTNAPEIAFHDSREILGIPPQQITPNPSQIAEMRHGYLAGISYMDAQVGKVLKALDDLKLTDRTIVVFASDHGYHVGEHTLWGKTSCFEYDARVPLIIATPSMKSAGKSTNALVELVDLFPTLTDLAGLDSPVGLEGVSLVPILNDPAATVKQTAFTQHPRPAYADRTTTGIPDAMGYSVRTPAGRYSEWRDWTTGKLVGAEYYDTERDPAELTNRIHDPAARDSIRTAQAALHAKFPPDIPPAKR